MADIDKEDNAGKPIGGNEAGHAQDTESHAAAPSNLAPAASPTKENPPARHSPCKGKYADILRKAKKYLKSRSTRDWLMVLFNGGLVLLGYFEYLMLVSQNQQMVDQNKQMVRQSKLMDDQLKSMRDQTAEMVEQTKASQGQWDATSKQYVAMLEANKVSALAADAAKAAADAATESNKVAERNAERQLRAYVHVASASFSETKTPGIYVLTLQIKNYGQTPAYSVTSYADFWYLKPPFQESKEAGLSVSMRPRGSGTIGPGGEIAVNMKTTIAKDKLEELRKVTLQLMAYGAISYYDMFSHHYFVPIRYRWGGNLGVEEVIPSVTGLPETVYEGVPDERIDDDLRLSPEELRRVMENFRKYGRGREDTIGDDKQDQDTPPEPMDR